MPPRHSIALFEEDPLRPASGGCINKAGPVNDYLMLQTVKAQGCKGEGPAPVSRCGCKGEGPPHDTRCASCYWGGKSASSIMRPC
jgi:hypothetical protein